MYTCIKSQSTCEETDTNKKCQFFNCSVVYLHLSNRFKIVIIVKL